MSGTSIIAQISMSLTLNWGLETPEWVLWQTVNTEMIMLGMENQYNSNVFFYQLVSDSILLQCKMVDCISMIMRHFIRVCTTYSEKEIYTFGNYNMSAKP